MLHPASSERCLSSVEPTFCPPQRLLETPSLLRRKIRFLKFPFDPIHSLLGPTDSILLRLARIDVGSGSAWCFPFSFLGRLFGFLGFLCRLPVLGFGLASLRHRCPRGSQAIATRNP